MMRAVTPATELGRLLAAARRAGRAFDVAWESAAAGAVAGLCGDERADWRAALDSTRDAWGAAWERRPPTRAERALHVVAGDDREALPDGYAGDCARCDAPILAVPGQRGTAATYCSGTCRKLASASRLAA